MTETHGQHCPCVGRMNELIGDLRQTITEYQGREKERESPHFGIGKWRETEKKLKAAELQVGGLERIREAADKYRHLSFHKYGLEVGELYEAFVEFRAAMGEHRKHSTKDRRKTHFAEDRIGIDCCCDDRGNVCVRHASGNKCTCPECNPKDWHWCLHPVTDEETRVNRPKAGCTKCH